MITREKAIDVIFELTEADILNADVLNALDDIRICIEEERIGRHVWGVPDDWITKLHTAYRDDMLTDEVIDEYDNIHKGIVFKPSTFETREIRENVREEMEKSVGEEVADEQIDWFMA